MRGRVGVAFGCEITRKDTERLLVALPNCHLFVVKDGRMTPLVDASQEADEPSYARKHQIKRTKTPALLSPRSQTPFGNTRRETPFLSSVSVPRLVGSSPRRIPGRQPRNRRIVDDWFARRDIYFVLTSRHPRCARRGERQPYSLICTGWSSRSERSRSMISSCNSASSSNRPLA